jgi:hypothetical protein
MDGKTILIVALAAGLAFWLGMMASKQPTYVAGPVDTGDTSTVGQAPDPGGVVWT